MPLYCLKQTLVTAEFCQFAAIISWQRKLLEKDETFLELFPEKRKKKQRKI